MFHIDVFIDLNGYRKYGHNESDEPSFTQPIEYRLIRSKKSIRQIYQDQLAALSISVDEQPKAFKKELQEALTVSKEPLKESVHEKDLFIPVKTSVSASLLGQMAHHFCTVPERFEPHPKLAKLLKERLEMVLQKDKKLDWGMAEILAYVSLLESGISLRLAGQDVGRGTFSHRHALWMDQTTDQAYFPLSHLQANQARADVINSPLSEFAALGFEYGYSIASLNALVIWEAQFGDFSNGGQIIIDQYLAAGEQKWGQTSTLVLLLPHGYEGQGPEHSSARLERYLSLCGNDNWFVCYPSTPAQFFHLLRRQVLSGFNKPLICLTPKQLLRHPECVSSVQDLEDKSFQEVLDDPSRPIQAKRLIFCSGKIFYELKKQPGMEEVAIICLEQLYPLHVVRIQELIAQYAHVKRFMWVQEEPSNMGAWSYIYPRLSPLLPPQASLEYIGRPMRASPATGSYAMHKSELADITGAL